MNILYALVENINNDYSQRIPLEDLDIIIINNNKTSITAKLLSQISIYNIALYICDEKQMPIGLYTSFNGYHRQHMVLNMQISQTESFKNKIWQSIVKSKILNQGSALEICIRNGCKDLELIGKTVKKGDETNREAYGAKVYFKNMFDDFKRGNDDSINGALNYGYTLLRGAVARDLVAHGFAPSMGVHHKNQLNNFNLADDFLEPFRPFVDIWVRKNMSYEKPLSSELKNEMIELLNTKCLFDNKKYRIGEAISLCVHSYYKTIETKNPELIKLPSILL